MTKELLISSSPHETKVAVLEDDQLVEVYFQRGADSGLVGGIYKGRVNRVLPGMQSAFVNIGLERDAFLYVSDFFEDSEEYDRVFTDAENRVARVSDQASGQPSQEATPGAPNAAPVPTQPPAAESQPETAAVSPAENETAAPREREPEIRRGDFRGRRQRRRGRGFRDSRFAPRHEATNPPHELHSHEPSRPIEPLPGESLARYHSAAEQTTETAPETEAPASAGAVSELAADASSSYAPETTTSASQTYTESSDADVDESNDVSRELETHPAAAPEQETQISHEVETEFAAAISAQHDAGDESSTVTYEFRQSLEFSEFTAQPASAQSAETPAVEEASAGPIGAEPPSPAPNEEEQSTGDSPEKSYTLRDNSQRQRIAPRRGRRSGRPFRGHHGRRPEAADRSRSGNHQPMAINELLKEGQEILVQIAKEPLGTKGARITSHIALPGRYLVYMPTITHIGVSRKIGSDEERLRLRNILLENRGSLTGGFIVRTAGAGKSEEELKADLSFLTNLWNEIRAKAERSKAPALLHGDLTLVERILRDLLSPEFKCVRVDNEIEYEHVLEFVNQFQPALIGQVRLHTRETPLFEEYGVQAEIDKALKPKVWLRSGGYIVINQTEALVAIDVNTGKYVGKTNRLEDTIVKTNIDAVMEIVRQIRLRDLGGIIVIDFIDMDERRNRAKVVQALEEELRRDRSPTKILSFNEFGLVALTRKRAKQSLERTLCEPCPYCGAAGWVKSVPTVTNEIVSEARKMASQIDGPVMTLRVNPQVGAALKAKAGAMISEIETAAGKEVIIKSDASVHQERYEIF